MDEIEALGAAIHQQKMADERASMDKIELKPCPLCKRTMAMHTSFMGGEQVIKHANRQSPCQLQLAQRDVAGDLTQAWNQRPEPEALGDGEVANLVKRLNAGGTDKSNCKIDHCDCAIMDEAASTITTLSTSNAKLEALVKVSRDALKWFVVRKWTIQAKFDLHGPDDTAKAMRTAYIAAEKALASIKQGGDGESN